MFCLVNIAYHFQFLWVEERWVKKTTILYSSEGWPPPCLCCTLWFLEKLWRWHNFFTFPWKHMKVMLFGGTSICKHWQSAYPSIILFLFWPNSVWNDYYTLYVSVRNQGFNNHFTWNLVCKCNEMLLVGAVCQYLYLRGLFVTFSILWWPMYTLSLLFLLRCGYTFFLCASGEVQFTFTILTTSSSSALGWLHG